MSANRKYVEREVPAASGWAMLLLNILMYGVGPWLFVRGEAANPNAHGLMWAGVVVFLGAILVSIGFFVVYPNEAKAMILFGKYGGTVKGNGFFWNNPFYQRIKVSLRARSLNGDKLKVNDKSGNPIEIAVIVVWRVRDTVEALFDVDDYVQYVRLQSETAVRHLASAYPYDEGEHGVSLRGATDEVNLHLQRELQERLLRAGVEVIEARLSHLAYAPEIAGEMLRRQQATAVVAARTKIVEGAVGMVEMALEALNKKNIVNLDEERKAAMVSNLLVVLCSDRAAQPVVNTGTLYQ